MDSQDLDARLSEILRRTEKIYIRLCSGTGRECIASGCEDQAVCNYAGLAPAYCEDHAAFDMDRQVGAVLRKKGMCTYMCMNASAGPQQCTRKVKFGLIGCSPNRCESHCEIGYIARPLRRCQETGEDFHPVKCKKRAIFGGTFNDGAHKCEEHRKHWDYDESVKACVKCDLPTLWYKKICFSCDPDPDRRGTIYDNRQTAANEAFAKLAEEIGWRSLNFRVTPTAVMETATLTNGNRAIVVEYTSRYMFNADLEMIPRVAAARERLAALNMENEIRVAFLFVSCGTYRCRKQKSVAWSGALKETVEMARALTADPALWHRLSYVKLFHNDYVRGSTFDKAEQILLY